ncbi:hypothetical protein SNE40_023137 [Patella caerulea]
MATFPNHADMCQTLPTEIEIVKEIRVEHLGRDLVLSCVAKIRVNKCEGVCVSSVSPSVMNHRGLKKDCKCCRERELVSRDIVLHECYHDGELIPGIRQTQVMEPVDCGCYECHN